MPWSPVPSPTQTTHDRPLMRVIHDPNGVGYATTRTKTTSQQKISERDVELVYVTRKIINYKNMPTAFEMNSTISQYFKSELEPDLHDHLCRILDPTDSRFANKKIEDSLKEYKHLTNLDDADDFTDVFKDFKNPYHINIKKTHNQNRDSDDADSQTKHKVINSITDYKSYQGSQKLFPQLAYKTNLDSDGSDKLFPENYDQLAFHSTPY